MGCCFSSSTATKPPHTAPAPPPMAFKAVSPPPQPAPEEETVKEVVVLSEKHVEKPKQPEIAQVTQPDRSTEELKPPVKFQRPRGEGEISHVSQTSEVPSNSVTETFSTTATTATTATVKEDEATSREIRAVGQRSPAKTVRKRPLNVDQRTGRARRLEASTPEKRSRGRGQGSGEMRTAVRTNVGSRSRSPATARAGGVGRSSGKICEKNEGPAGPKPLMSAGPGARSGEGGVQIRSNPNADAKNDVVPDQVGNQSLELECFIFL